jgi:hypothetical protein
VMSVASLILTAGVTQPAGSIAISPGTNIQSVVNANPAGAVFYLKAGVHRMQSIQPKDNQVFLGETGATLNGSRLLTSFSREGVYWVANGQTQEFPIDAG